MLRPGKRTLKLRLRRDRWPTKLGFTVVDPAAPPADEADDDEAITTAVRQRTHAR